MRGERVWGDRDREKGRERIPSRLLADCGALYRVQSHDPKNMTLAEIRSQLLNRLCHPGSPTIFFKKLMFLTKARAHNQVNVIVTAIKVDNKMENRGLINIPTVLSTAM